MSQHIRDGASQETLPFYLGGQKRAWTFFLVYLKILLASRIFFRNKGVALWSAFFWIWFFFISRTLSFVAFLEKLMKNRKWLVIIEMEEILFISSFSACLGYILADTKAFEEYLRILNWIFALNLKVFKENPLLDNFAFREKFLATYDYFIFRLLFCPICLSVWSCFACCVLIGNFKIYFTSLLASWIFYLTLNKLTYNEWSHPKSPWR